MHSLRANLEDPNNVLQSWDPTLVNPCTWFHVTCNNENSVIRVYVISLLASFLVNDYFTADKYVGINLFGKISSHVALLCVISEILEMQPCLANLFHHLAFLRIYNICKLLYFQSLMFTALFSRAVASVVGMFLHNLLFGFILEFSH